MRLAVPGARDVGRILARVGRTSERDVEKGDVPQRQGRVRAADTARGIADGGQRLGDGPAARPWSCRPAWKLVGSHG
ncbi:hypothetical protein AN216_06285 [Streptomyces oceani]|uniref:Uncharacterized protein n=1 Tax=Streptomyces oceani TaxID=1075402 RepID=A0A1E7KL16_9ACTN|nr:hypothetical protein AN216_06285 [Streptomyces oceani]